MLSERFAAAKALGFLGNEKAMPLLVGRLNDVQEHIYVRLEAAATLIKLEQAGYLAFLEQLLKDTYFQNRLETVIVLSELKTKSAINLLTKVIFDDEQPVEVRAGAAWALGETKNAAVSETLIKAFDVQEVRIKEDAARALLKIGGKTVEELLGALQNDSADIRAGAAWSLSRIKELDIKDLVSKLQNGESRKWVAWILGYKNRDEVETKLKNLKDKDPGVYFAATVLWTALKSWISDLE